MITVYYKVKRKLILYLENIGKVEICAISLQV